VQDLHAIANGKACLCDSEASIARPCTPQTQVGRLPPDIAIFYIYHASAPVKPRPFYSISVHVRLFLGRPPLCVFSHSPVAVTCWDKHSFGAMEKTPDFSFGSPSSESPEQQSLHGDKEDVNKTEVGSGLLSAILGPLRPD